jgi:hypothetical protein
MPVVQFNSSEGLQNEKKERTLTKLELFPLYADVQSAHSVTRNFFNLSVFLIAIYISNTEVTIFSYICYFYTF